MSTNITIQIRGMTCLSCENKIQRKLLSTNGIITSKVSYSSNKAIITFDESLISSEKIIKMVEKLGYSVMKTMPDKKDKPKLTKIFGVGIIILALYMILKRFGVFDIFNIFPEAEKSMGYGMLFIIGMLTSLHCVAMCGGINLSQCIPKGINDSNKASTKLSTLTPSILYNLGRVFSYTIIGAIVGALGSIISFSGTTKGIVQLAAGIFMVIMGINMLNLFPWLRKFNPRMPKIFSRKINQQKVNKGPFYVGLLNGLMPCGPLQAMQLYALSTGDPLKGAISMFLFSLGTVPLMFGLGALSSFINKKFTSKMMTASAVLVIVLGVFMFNNGIGLSGFTLPSINIGSGSNLNDNSENSADVIITDEVQIITSELSSNRYEPITVQKGIPVKWILKAEAENINGCNNRIIIPEYKLNQKLTPGDNIFEFTPTESGTFGYSCWMGMIRSNIKVVD